MDTDTPYRFCDRWELSGNEQDENDVRPYFSWQTLQTSCLIARDSP